MPPRRSLTSLREMEMRVAASMASARRRRDYLRVELEMAERKLQELGQEAERLQGHIFDAEQKEGGQ